MERDLWCLVSLIAFLVAYNLAKGYGKDPIGAGIVSAASFFTLGAATSGMNSVGLFIALLVGIAVAEIFTRLVGNKKLVIKMPDGVPPAVATSFASLFPAMITIAPFEVDRSDRSSFGVKDMFAAFYAAVQEPFMGLANFMVQRYLSPLSHHSCGSSGYTVRI